MTVLVDALAPRELLLVLDNCEHLLDACRQLVASVVSDRCGRVAWGAAYVSFYLVFSLVKLACTHIAGSRCFEDGRFNDMRMPAMATQIAPVLRQIEKVLETAEPAEPARGAAA